MRAAADARVLVLLLAACAAACGKTTQEGAARPGSEVHALAPRNPPTEAEPDARVDSFEAVGRILGWLEERQNADGSWGSTGDPGLTGVVVLAYVGTGETHNAGPHADTIRAALRYLRDVQEDDGAFTARGDEVPAASHLRATLGLCEAYGLTGSRLFAGPARRAVEHALTTRGADGAWGDAEAALWGAMVLRSARLSELAPDIDVGTPLAAVATRLRVLAAEDTVPLPRETLRAGAAYARVLAGEIPSRSEDLRTGILRIADLPAESWAPGGARDHLGTYLAASAIWYLEDNDVWDRWHDWMHEAICTRTPDLPRDDDHLDEILHGAALDALTRMVPERYRRVFRASDR